MATTFKPSVSRGFTLIELLIVVVILAILAAIAIPQFSSSTSDAQASALDANLATVRSALEQYKAQHKNVYPGDAAATGASCVTGATAAPTGATAGTVLALTAQLSNYSNADGQTCDTPSPGYNYGPYLRKGIPVEPVTSKGDVAITSAGKPITAGTAGGWAYDTKSGQFIANTDKTDSSSKPFSGH